MNIETFKAKFIREGHNRFISFIELNGKIIECYVPSSAKMSNFLNLIGKEVLITKNLDITRRTKYSLFAVKYYNKYIILNLNLVNRLLMKYLTFNSPGWEFALEKSVYGYKSDILMKSNEGEITLLEAKGIISTRRSCVFPSKISKRALIQLNDLKHLLIANNLNITYYLISLGPITKKILIEDSNSEYIKLLKACMSEGMILKALSVEYTEHNFVFRVIPIEFT